MNCQMASGGVLEVKVVQTDGDQPNGTMRPKPIIPNIAYKGPSRLPDDPTGMTWKHLLLSAVHDSAMGAHKSPAEMQAELSALVDWNPQYMLKQDCQAWRDRCSHCTTGIRKTFRITHGEVCGHIQTIYQNPGGYP